MMRGGQRKRGKRRYESSVLQCESCGRKFWRYLHQKSCLLCARVALLQWVCLRSTLPEISTYKRESYRSGASAGRERKREAMKFRIHFEHNDGTEDYFDVSGETLEQVRDIANKELFKRTHNAIAPVAWSEELKEPQP